MLTRSTRLPFDMTHRRLLRKRVLNTGPLLCLAAMVGCTAPESPTTGGSVWNEVRPEVAQHFTVLRNGSMRRLLVFADPEHRDTISDLTVGPGDRTVQRLVVLSTTHLPYISTLGCTDRIVGAAYLDHVRDVEMKKRMASGEVKPISTADGADREAIIALSPDLVLGYPFGRTSGEKEIAGVPLALVAEYLEADPLGRAEWLTFFGALLGKEREADSIYAGIADRYAKAKPTAGNGKRPKVLFGSHWNGQWWVPPGDSYMAQLITDAGGDYVFSDLKGKENIAVDLETILSRASNADAWGMIAEIPSTPSVQDFTGGDERLVGLKAVREQFLFLGNTARSDLFGQALVEPDVVVKELRDIFGTTPQVTDGNPASGRYFGTLGASAPMDQ